MADALDAAATARMLDAAAVAIIANVEVLTAADQAVGDGDHGIGMRRGFEAARAKLAAEPPATVEAACRAVGTAVMGATGGAAGAVFGTLFRSGGAALAGRETLDAAGFATLLQTGLEAVMKRGGVGAGQKTMIDALMPAAAAAAKAADGPLAAATAAAAAARQGVEATRGMIATTGKARTLGERSLGHPDPGAISMALILEAMRDVTARL